MRYAGKRLLKRGALILIVAVGAIQFVPVDRTNPPIEMEVPVSSEVRAVLRRACYDCHSNETVWPWYSRIAPVSWLIGRDVHHGREELNFSTWNRLNPRKQAKIIQEIGEEVEEGEMPPWFYLPAHPEARLSRDDLATLQTWALSSGEQSRTASRP